MDMGGEGGGQQTEDEGLGNNEWLGAGKNKCCQTSLMAFILFLTGFTKRVDEGKFAS